MVGAALNVKRHAHCAWTTDGDAQATDGDAQATDGDAQATDGDAQATDGDTLSVDWMLFVRGSPLFAQDLCRAKTVAARLYGLNQVAAVTQFPTQTLHRFLRRMAVSRESHC